ncbi:hypothetical protein [Actinomadura craniellae]|uniref:hypothetical protein n=1 Tax=Actinomadura craniellae TaxID=2231787 RepID=UPI0011BFC950|nr:hypothetical protein [Actinomadura craniellae]
MRYTKTAVVAVSILATAAGCASEQTALRQIRPNAVVYIDGWNQKGDEGDRALIERKPSGMWVIPVNAPFRGRRVGEFTVRVTLDPRRGFVVTDLGGTRVGRDHDDCLETGEIYAFLDVPGNTLNWEPDAADTGVANDDCVVAPAG